MQVPSFIEKIPNWLKNKYVVTLIIFFIWLLFFDNNDIISQIETRQHLNELREEKTFYKEQVKKTRQELKELNTDPQTLEKFAREKYLMKKENEDIFVIVDKNMAEERSSFAK